jgi:hypothetical protein
LDDREYKFDLVSDLKKMITYIRNSEPFKIWFCNKTTISKMSRENLFNVLDRSLQFLVDNKQVLKLGNNNKTILQSLQPDNKKFDTPDIDLPPLQLKRVVRRGGEGKREKEIKQVVLKPLKSDIKKFDLPDIDLDPLPKVNVQRRKEIKQSNITECVKEIDNINKYLISGRKHMFKTDKQIQTFTTLMEAIYGYDFYGTPEKYSNFIYEDIMRIQKKEEFNLLDAGAGLCSFSMPYIKNGLNGGKLYLIEFNQTFYDIIKCFNKASNISVLNENFLEFEMKNNNLNYIIMNPPFKGPVELDNKMVTVTNLYIYFIIKGLVLLSESDFKFEKILYVICPKTLFSDRNYKPGDVVETNIPNSVYKKILGNIKNSENIIDEYEEGTYDLVNVQIQFMADVTGFKKLDKRGKIQKLGFTFGLYKFITW